ncbi:hypothetical protein J1N10_03660 [Carboxylicivirga sp. A043]|uniref:hypothetical protein n=1 Tax=Carboxylicivirga litoralis TaxID=2816963 RepID=UPI0021CB1D13|nr:hypothetical protein [Carboxylicivirga sp. A043]MCU4155056.1 hypothetical protein [Carboxylicivirga sp. A043]
MNYITKIAASLMAGILILSSCGEVEKQDFKDSDAYFAFETSKSVMLENDIRTLRIPVSLAKSTGIGEVTFEVVTEGFDNPAVEGEDFTVKTSNKTVAFEGDWVKNIEIKMIDNYVRDGDKKFKLLLKDNNIGAGIGMANNANTEHIITISDNEHPLAGLIGYDFQATEQSIATDADGIQIAPYTLDVEIRPDTVAGRDDRLLVKGLLGVPQELCMVFDTETGVVSMEGEKYYNVIDPYFGIAIELTFYGWHYGDYDEENDKPTIVRDLVTVGTFDLEAQEIIFDAGYLAQITGPSTHPYVGLSYTTLIIEHCRIAKK